MLHVRPLSALAATCRAMHVVGRIATAAFVVAVALNASAGDAASPVQAEGDEPFARMQMVIKRIVIHDDQDWGKGDFALTARVWEIVDGCPVDVHPDVPDYYPGCTRILAEGTFESSVTDGTVLTPDRLIPSSGDVIGDPSISAAFGIPLFADRRYGWSIAAVEKDPALDDGMGHLGGRLLEENGWGPLGRTISERGTVGWSSFFPPGFGSKPAYYSVEYEFRLVPLPDLRPVGINVLDLPGSTDKLVCMAVQNVGALEAGAFEATLYVDGVAPPNGKALAGRLDAPGSGDLCVETALPDSGEHRLAAVVDEPHGIFEQNEANNRFEQPYVATRVGPSDGPIGAATGPGVTTGRDPGSSQPPSPPRPEPSPPPSQADLTVRAIRIRGEAPDGEDDCEDGGNGVTVVINNGGAAGTGSFVVRLMVDDDQGGAEEKTVSGLDARQEREVRFDDVRLKEGRRTLTATVDAGKVVAESDEANNSRAVTASCEDRN